MNDGNVNSPTQDCLSTLLLRSLNLGGQLFWGGFFFHFFFFLSGTGICLLRFLFVFKMFTYFFNSPAITFIHQGLHSRPSHTKRLKHNKPVKGVSRKSYMRCSENEKLLKMT